MDPVEAVQTLLSQAALLLHPHPSSQIPASSLLATRTLLQKMTSPSPSQSDIAAFCILTSLDSIRTLLECRRHSEWARLDSWPNALLSYLSYFCSWHVLNEKLPLGTHEESTLNQALGRGHLAACSQLPGTSPELAS